MRGQPMLTHGILKHVDRVRLGAQLSRIFRALTCSAYMRYLNDLVIPHAVELKDIKAVIDLMRKNDLSVFEMEKDGFRLKLQKGSGELPAFAAAARAQAAPRPRATPPAAPAPEPEKGGAQLKDILSPMVGTFYRASSPESPAFADVGKAVTEESVVCIIEAMKVMNEIKAETKGV